MSRDRMGSVTIVSVVRRILAAVVLTTLASACISAPRPLSGWTKGMGASALSFKADGGDDRLTTFDGPDQILNVGYRWPGYSIEGLFSFTRQGFEDSDANSSLFLGGQANYLFGSAASTMRPLVGIAGFATRESGGGESSTRPGAQLVIGAEGSLMRDLLIRLSAMYGLVSEDEDHGFPKETFFGVRADFFGSLPSQTPRDSGDWILRSGLTWTQIDPDGQNSRNTLRIPGAAVGMYYEGWRNNQLRLGGDFDVHRASFGNASQTSFNLYPSVEYDVISGYQTGVGLRLRGLTSLRYESFDSGFSDGSGTVFGYGAGFRVTMPVSRTYTGAVGLDYVMSGENEDLFVPEKNTMRLVLSLERALAREY